MNAEGAQMHAVEALSAVICAKSVSICVVTLV
jgi:hypothetical protein